MTRKFTTPAANWDGHSGRPNGPPPRRVITWSLYVPLTGRATCRHGNLIAVHSLGLPVSITSVCRLRRRIGPPAGAHLGPPTYHHAVSAPTDRRYSSSSRAVQLARCAKFY